MTSKNPSPKAVDATEAPEAEASVPQQNTGDKVTVLKGRSEDGKDAVIISDGEEVSEDEDGVPNDDSFKSRFTRLIRNKKVLAGLGTVAAIAIFAVAKGLMANSDEELVADIVEPAEPADDNTDTE